MSTRSSSRNCDASTRAARPSVVLSVGTIGSFSAARVSETLTSISVGRESGSARSASGSTRRTASATGRRRSPSTPAPRCRRSRPRRRVRATRPSRWPRPGRRSRCRRRRSRAASPDGPRAGATLDGPNASASGGKYALKVAGSQDRQPDQLHQAGGRQHLHRGDLGEARFDLGGLRIAAPHRARRQRPRPRPWASPSAGGWMKVNVPLKIVRAGHTGLKHRGGARFRRLPPRLGVAGAHPVRRRVAPAKARPRSRRTSQRRRLPAARRYGSPDRGASLAEGATRLGQDLGRHGIQQRGPQVPLLPVQRNVDRVAGIEDRRPRCAPRAGSPAASPTPARARSRRRSRPRRARSVAADRAAGATPSAGSATAARRCGRSRRAVRRRARRRSIPSGNHRSANARRRRRPVADASEPGHRAARHRLRLRRDRRHHRARSEQRGGVVLVFAVQVEDDRQPLGGARRGRAGSTRPSSRRSPRSAR